MNNRSLLISIGIYVCHINICGMFYYLYTILDGYSRAIISWEIGGQMTESDVELTIEKAKEKYPEARAAGHSG